MTSHKEEDKSKVSKHGEAPVCMSRKRVSILTPLMSYHQLKCLFLFYHIKLIFTAISEKETGLFFYFQRAKKGTLARSFLIQILWSLKARVLCPPAWGHQKLSCLGTHLFGVWISCHWRFPPTTIVCDNNSGKMWKQTVPL